MLTIFKQLVCRSSRRIPDKNNGTTPERNVVSSTLWKIQLPGIQSCWKCIFEGLTDFRHTKNKKQNMILIDHEAGREIICSLKSC